MKVRDILSSVTVRYNDTDYVRLSKDQYLKFLDDSISKLILVRPDSHVKTAIHGLSQGTRQVLPSDGVVLIDIYMNKEDNGDGTWANGAPVLQVERKDLDYFSDWHNAGSTTSDIDEFAYDARSPKTFWVSPPPANADEVFVEMDYATPLPPFSEMSDDFDTILEMDIDMEDTFKSALIAYMLYLCYSTDSGSANDMAIAAQYEQSFYQGLGIEYEASLMVQPKIEVTEVAR